MGIDFFQDKYLNLKNLADGYLTTSAGVQSELEKIQKVLNGSQMEHTFGPSDWCMVDVKDEDSIIYNGFNEFEPIKIKTNEFYNLLFKWSIFLRNVENESNSDISENIKIYNGSERIESRKETFFSSLKYFDRIQEKYKMKKEIDSDYEYGAAKFFNNKCEINIGFDRYCENLEMDFTDTITKQTYNYAKVFKALGVYNGNTSKNKSDIVKSQLEDKIEFITFALEKYCNEILNGNFSELNR